MGTLVHTRPDETAPVRDLLELSDQASSVTQGRKWLRRSIAGDRRFDADRLQDMELVYSELLTNAYRHALGASRRVGFLSCSASQILLGVGDNDLLRQPCMRGCGLDATGGRGLFLVEELADYWGCRVFEEQKVKIVWAVFLAPPTTPALPLVPVATIRL